MRIRHLQLVDPFNNRQFNFCDYLVQTNHSNGYVCTFCTSSKALQVVGWNPKPNPKIGRVVALFKIKWK